MVIDTNWLKLILEIATLAFGAGILWATMHNLRKDVAVLTKVVEQIRDNHLPHLHSQLAEGKAALIAMTAEFKMYREMHP